MKVVYGDELKIRLLHYAYLNPYAERQAEQVAGELSDSVETLEQEYYRALLRLSAGWNIFGGVINKDVYEHAAKLAHKRSCDLLRQANDADDSPAYQATLRARAYEASKEATEYYALAFQHAHTNGTLPVDSGE